MGEGFRAETVIEDFFDGPEEAAYRLIWENRISAGLEERGSLSAELSEQQNYRLAVMSSE